MSEVRVVKDYIEEKEDKVNEEDVMKTLEEAFDTIKGVERKFDKVRWIVRDYERINYQRQHYRDVCEVSTHPLTDEHRKFIAKSIYPTNVGGHDTKIITELKHYKSLEEVVYFREYYISGYISDKVWDRVIDIAKVLLIKELKRSICLLENNE